MKQCEYEDSTNCIWDAKNQGNGEGHSFVDIDGSVYYTDDPTVYEDVWVDEGESFPYQYVIAQVDGEDYVVVTWVGETTYTEEVEAVEEVEEVVTVEEVATVEVVELVETTAQPVEPMVEELAETGTAEVVSGALLGIALVITGVVTMMKGRRVA